MPRRRPSLPPFVRARKTGFRGVVRICGERHYGPTCRTPEEAADWVARILGNPESAGTDREPWTLADGLQALLRDLRDTGGRDGTTSYYKRAFSYVARVIAPATLLRDIDAIAIRHYIERRRGQGLALATIVRKELATLRRIVRLAVAAGALVKDPFVGLKMPKIRRGRFECMTAAEVDDVLAAMRSRKRESCHRNADVVELVWRSGLRRAEVVRLRVRDVSFPRGDIFVEGKTGNRYVPIAKALVPALRRLVDTAREDGRLVDSEDAVERLFERWKKRLGLRAFSPHVLRHSFITDCLSRGVPAHEVAELVGHSTTRQLDRYAHVLAGRLRRAVDGLGEGSSTPATRSSSGGGRGRREGSGAPRARRPRGSTASRRRSTGAGTCASAPSSAAAPS